MLERELLRHAPAPGDAHHVHLVDPVVIEQAGREPGHHPGPVGQHSAWRSAHARHVESDDVAVGDPVAQRGHQFDIGADAVEEQDRPALRALGLPVRDAHGAPADADKLDLGRAGRRRSWDQWRFLILSPNANRADRRRLQSNT
jgi:hypothetical protein